MKTALVGYTGFVGSNLNISYQFTSLYNSKNIRDAYGTEPDILVYAGLPATMFKANEDSETDFSYILQAIANIKAINPKKVVLISSVAVYDRTFNVDEEYVIKQENLLPYGKNRLYLEKWIDLNCESCLVVRLPSLFGINLKKNFIYDYINIIPALLNAKKYRELADKCNLIKKTYLLKDDNYYHFIAKGDNKKKVYKYFCSAEFNAISFTDSRSIYQFYNLRNLWSDIQIALQNGIRMLNVVTEPISVAEVYRYLSGKEFVNKLPNSPYIYNIKSIHADLFGGSDGYLYGKKDLLPELKQYVDQEKHKIWG